MPNCALEFFSESVPHIQIIFIFRTISPELWLWKQCFLLNSKRVSEPQVPLFSREGHGNGPEDSGQPAIRRAPLSQLSSGNPASPFSPGPWLAELRPVLNVD